MASWARCLALVLTLALCGAFDAPYKKPPYPTPKPLPTAKPTIRPKPSATLPPIPPCGEKSAPVSGVKRVRCTSATPAALGGKKPTSRPKCDHRVGKDCVQYSHTCEEWDKGTCLTFGPRLDCWQWDGCGSQRRCIAWNMKCNEPGPEGSCRTFGELKEVNNATLVEIKRFLATHVATCCASGGPYEEEPTSVPLPVNLTQATHCCSVGLREALFNELEGAARVLLDEKPAKEWASLKQMMVSTQKELRSALENGKVWIQFETDAKIVLEKDLVISHSNTVIDARGVKVDVMPKLPNQTELPKVIINATNVIIVGLNFKDFSPSQPGRSWHTDCGAECKTIAMLFMPRAKRVWIHRCQFSGLGKAISIEDHSTASAPPRFRELRSISDGISNDLSDQDFNKANPMDSPGSSPMSRDLAKWDAAKADVKELRITISWCSFSGLYHAIAVERPGLVTIHHTRFREVAAGTPMCKGSATKIHAYNVVATRFGKLGAAVVSECRATFEDSYFRKGSHSTGPAMQCFYGVASVNDVMMPGEASHNPCGKFKGTSKPFSPCNSYGYSSEFDPRDQSECHPLPDCDAKKCVEASGWKETLKLVVSKPTPPTCTLLGENVQLYRIAPSA